MSKKAVFVILAVVLVICCIMAFVLVLVFKDSILNFISPTTTPTPIVSVIVTPTTAPSDVNGTWSGSYTVNYPKACAGDGNWSANLLEENSTLSGSYSSDIGLGGNVTGSVSGSEINWSVGGSGGVTFDGNIVSTSVGGTFTGPACGGSTYTSGSFSGNKQ
jgi:hypothetical protein